MRKFWGSVTNGDYTIGCTGQTVYLLDKDQHEIKKFKDIIYAYTPAISPNGKIFIVKSTEGRLAVYSLETFSLIKKFRFSKVDDSQDDGFCFSPDGALFINVERQISSLHSAISIYDTSDFSLANQILLEKDRMLAHIEFDDETNAYYVLGFIRDADRVFDYGFVARFEENQIKDITPISKKEYDFYRQYKGLEIGGFTEKAFQWSYIGCSLDELKANHHSLKELFLRYNK